MEVSVVQRTLSPSIFHFTCFFLSRSTHLLPHVFQVQHPQTLLLTFSLPPALCSIVFCIKTETVVHFNQLKDTGAPPQCFLAHEENVKSERP